MEKKLLEQGIEWLIECRISQLANNLGTHAFVFDAGWTPELGAGFTRYLLGDIYQPDGYYFEGYFITPKISPSKLFIDWLENVRGWLSAFPAEPDKYMHSYEHEDYFFSMLDYVQPAFFLENDHLP